MVVIVMGVSGAGKTTVGETLAHALGWRFWDADDFHSAGNVAKMAAGTPLTDADRAPWLERLRELIQDALESDEGLVLACSALRESYRERLTVDAAHQRWVYLRASRELLAQRLARREGHYMPASLLDTQLAALEPPRDALAVDASEAPDGVVARILQGLGLKPSGSA